MPTDRFSGKVMLVTGGATGIGAATLSRFARLGADVACCY
jgi:NAD(P)-dependent dehydrogenase (short-subunit alcohol dehydrogenase family)